ncbi:uncharacterized protein B0H18DRAFT_965708 [Fomitopsis serialis]|uniref:uncharacterized protein n=1 Tax=Fomitopsis serialis TaxID=139415 RepID=UPI0020086D19|nr:uncharacterized protein B0H18DRAFT_965708 [Neoantrodia serialis]KAH9938123.1 hypothetical protein B0H18DRAFT_965708 [Neoantrodia serialis]
MAFSSTPPTTTSPAKSRSLANTFIAYRMASTSAANWVDAQDGGVIKVNNPATEGELGTVPEMGLAETKQAIDAASRAFNRGARQPRREHGGLARIITLENGKPLAEAKWFGMVDCISMHDAPLNCCAHS